MVVAEHPPNDVGVLISILHTAEPSVWRNVGRSVRRLRPRWSSLAVDLWNRDSNTSATSARHSVLTRHAGVLALFSRVLFLDTASRSDVPSHVRPSFSYRLHWHAAFSDSLSRGEFGMHSEGLPTLLVGVDADVTVPSNLPVSRLSEILDRSRSPSKQVVLDAETRARQAWLHGRVPRCSTAGSLAPSSSTPTGAQFETLAAAGEASASASEAATRGTDAEGRAGVVTTSSTTISPCEVVSADHQPLYLSVRDLSRLQLEQRTSFGELGMYLYPLRLGKCCGRQNTNAPAALRVESGASVATLSRGPWCPPSTFFVVHKRSLDRVLSGFKLWQRAWDARALTRDKKRLRWEYVACTLLAPGESVLLLYYNYSQLADAVVHAGVSTPLSSAGST
jgi:hypothetical protein